MNLKGPSLNTPGSVLRFHSQERPAALSFRWAVRNSAVQMFPATSRRSFKWSYLLSRTLRSFHSGNYR